jgi:[ribosomal protein S18]-alanine N-acetyltransferase
MAHCVRPARPVDASLLASLDGSVNLNPWSEQQFAAACSGVEGAGNSALIVEEGGRVDGFVVISQVLDEASIHSIAVHPDQQGKGLGQRLLKAALVKMHQSGAQRCLLEVRQSNIAARRLYERSGFVLDGVRKNYYPTRSGREDALLLSCQIKGNANERA